MIPSEYRNAVQINPLQFPLLLFKIEDAKCWTNQLLKDPPSKAERLYAMLTPQEKVVVSRMALGLRTKEIGETLNISPFTVQCHIRHVFKKIKARNPAHLIALLSGFAP